MPGVRTLDGPEAARTLRDVTAEESADSEHRRTLNERTVNALWESGLMQWCNPREAGGSEPAFPEMIDTWIELAWQDGSLGWIGIANLPSAAACAAYLPDEGFDEVFTRNANRVTAGGQFFPNGLGETLDDGYRLTGAWNFGSGTGHSQYVAAGFIPTVDGQMVVGADGIPPLMVAVIPRDEIVFTDGWHVQGLRGTGSYDYNVSELFVPRYRTFELFCRTPERGGSPAFRMGLMPITAAGHASWALGVAKSMIDDVTELALTKVRMGDDASIAHRTSFQRNLAHHSAMWKATRLLVVSTFGEVEEAVRRGGELTPTMRADMRVAATYATESSREIVHWAHLAGGTTAIREGSRLERAFRDMYAGTQHVFIGEKTYTDSAQIYLGLIDDQLGL
jgi:alkylation response protein AidB-like acyl-CoA dehydrogenase